MIFPMTQSCMDGKPVMVGSYPVSGLVVRNDSTPEIPEITRTASDESKKMFYEPLSAEDDAWRPANLRHLLRLPVSDHDHLYSICALGFELPVRTNAYHEQRSRKERVQYM